MLGCYETVYEDEYYQWVSVEKIVTDFDVMDHFEVILLALQLLLDLLVPVDDDGEKHVDQDPAHRHREEEEHHRCNRVRFLKVFSTNFSLFHLFCF